MSRHSTPIFVLAFLLTLSTATLARQGAPPSSRHLDLRPAAEIPVYSLPAVDVEAELGRDLLSRKEAGPAPLRFAVVNEVAITMENTGLRESLANGDSIWRLRVHVPNATDLNFGFTSFRLPDGASLYVISEEDGYFEGPYTFHDNASHGELWTPPVPGERAILEVYLPAVGKHAPELELTRVSGGYRDLFGGQVLKQGACNIDVVCPEGDAWRDEIRSVGVYSFGGGTLCTGTMIMDVPRSFRPFFLTANHCGVNAGNAPSMVVFWNFESANCGDLSGGSLADNQTGATFRASRTDVDMALVELEEQPDPAHGVYWSGWDRSGDIPQGSVAIHHPNTDEKAISFNDDPLTTVNTCIGGGGSNTHWEVDNWEQGTTEPGSSGSGIWDPNNKKLIGFLSGGLASCSNPGGFDCYGKFSVAWDLGGTSSTQLKDWLDPLDQGDMMVDGADPSPSVFYSSHQGTDSCAMASNVNGLWEPGEMVQVQVEVRGSGDFTGVQGVLSTTTPGVTVVDNTASWPDLASGTPAASLAPHFTILLDGGLDCFAEIDFQVEITTTEGGPFSMTFSEVLGAPLQADLPIPLVDSGTATSILNVADNVTLSDLDLLVDLNHSWVGDLTLTLQSPAGTLVTLLDRPGVPADSTVGCGDNNMLVTFDDGAPATDLENHCAGTDPWFTGAALPVDALAGFNGETTAGNWTLSIADGAGQDSGTLNDWRLLTTPAIAGTCNVCALFADGFETGNTAGWSVEVP